MAATWSWLGGSDGNAASAPANWDLISSLGPPPDLPSIGDFITINTGTVVVSDDTLGAAQVNFNAGIVTVATGGTWDVANELTMGTANLLIDGGGTVAVSFPEGSFTGLFDDFGGGTISVDGIASSLSVNNGGQLALGIDGTSVLDVSSGGSVLVNNFLSVGDGEAGFSGSGVVAVSDGSQVQVTAQLGLYNGSTVSVDATSSVLVGTGTAVAGAVVVSDGSGVSADGGTILGAVVVASSGGIDSGLEVTGKLAITGDLTLESGGATVAAGGTLDVGSQVTIGSANLLIDGGGTMAADVGTAGLPNAIEVGLLGGTSGTITVDGVGSALSVANSMTLGADGTGTLDVSNDGSALIYNDLWLGRGSGSGVVAVTGGGQVQATYSLHLYNGSAISVDPTSNLLLGTSGSVVPGAVVITDATLWGNDGTIAASVVDDNSGIYRGINATGSLEIAGSLSGTGDVTIWNDSVLRVDGAVDLASGGVIFDSAKVPTQSYLTFMADETLILQTPGTAFAPSLALIAGAKIELGDGIQITGATLESNGLLLTGSTTYVMSDVAFTALVYAPGVNPQQAGTPTGFTTGFDATTGDYFVQVGEVVPNIDLPVCFAAGTRIRTEDGDVPVECLRVGQRVPTMLDGEVSPIIWIGQRALDCRSHKNQRAVWPVRIAAGAFGPGAPVRDLWLSPDHAVFFEDVLIPVKYLINGGLIAQIPRDHVTYFHVELERHDLLLAEGLAVESYLDTGDRGFFGHAAARPTLGFDLARLWEALGCAKLVVTGPPIQAACACIAAQSAMVHQAA